MRQVTTEPVTVRGDTWANGWYYVGQQVISADRSVVWTTRDEWAGYGMGASYPHVLTWSRDSSAVFVADASSGDGCDLFGSLNNLDRLEVATGRITRVVKDAGGLTLSPDGDSVAYQSDTQSIVVRRMDGTMAVTGTLALKPGEHWQLGGHVWSPSGRAVAFTFSAEPCVSEGIARFDLDSGDVTILVPSTQGSLRIRDWDGADSLTLTLDLSD